MRLINLIKFFRQGGFFADFCKAQSLNQASEVIEVYAEKPVHLMSELGFFSIEETEGRVEFQSGGRRYQNLFDFFYFWMQLKKSVTAVS